MFRYLLQALLVRAGVATLLIDSFQSESVNALGYYHGSTGEGLNIESLDGQQSGKHLKASTADIDGKAAAQAHCVRLTCAIATFSTSLGAGCTDVTAYRDGYLQLTYQGSSKFTISLQQHNQWCDEARLPYPATWDSVEAARYARGQQHIYVPISNFQLDLKRINAIVLKSFYNTTPTYL